MCKKMMIGLGCLVVGLGILGANVLADLQTLIVGSRIIGADTDNYCDNSTDLCIFNSQLDLVHDTADQAGYTYAGIASGNYSYDGVAQVVVPCIDLPDNTGEYLIADNWTWASRMFAVHAADNVTAYEDDNSSWDMRNIIPIAIKTIEWGDGDGLDEWGVLVQRPLYELYVHFPITANYPLPKALLTVGNANVYQVKDGLPPDIDMNNFLE